MFQCSIVQNPEEKKLAIIGVPGKVPGPLCPLTYCFCMTDHYPLIMSHLGILRGVGIVIILRSARTEQIN